MSGDAGSTKLDDLAGRLVVIVFGNMLGDTRVWARGVVARRGRSERGAQVCLVEDYQI